jgi:hypothetical protein
MSAISAKTKVEMFEIQESDIAIIEKSSQIIFPQYQGH